MRQNLEQSSSRISNQPRVAYLVLVTLIYYEKRCAIMLLHLRMLPMIWDCGTNCSKIAETVYECHFLFLCWL